MRRAVRLSGVFTAFLLVLGFVFTPVASAQQQSINLTIGGFVPRSLDSRPGDDVLVNNLDTLIFNIHDFNGPTVGGEWLVALGNYFEGGLGIGYYSRTTPAIYSDFTNADGSEIVQDLKLRIIPFTATVRFLPLGRHASIQPYLGAGVGVLRFRYSETGEFVDFSDNSTFEGNFVGSGTATGPIVLGGVRFPMGLVDLGFEIKHQDAKGDLPTAPPNGPFAGTKIDLGGTNYLFSINIRF